MAIDIRIENKHIFVLGMILALFAGLILVIGYGGNDPTLVGHSAGELLVDSSSIVNGSIQSEDIADGAINSSKIYLEGCPAGQSIRNIQNGIITCETDDVNDGDTNSGNEIQSLGTSGSQPNIAVTLTSGGSVSCSSLTGSSTLCDASDGVGSCSTRTASNGGSTDNCARSCGAGETLTGGGCQCGSFMLESYPSTGAETWNCKCSLASTCTAYAECCNT